MPLKNLLLIFLPIVYPIMLLVKAFSGLSNGTEGWLGKLTNVISKLKIVQDVVSGLKMLWEGVKKAFDF